MLYLTLFFLGVNLQAKHVDLDSKNTVFVHEESYGEDLDDLFGEEDSVLDAASSVKCIAVETLDATLLQQVRVGVAFLWNEPTLCLELAVGQVKDILGING